MDTINPAMVPFMTPTFSFILMVPPPELMVQPFTVNPLKELLAVEALPVGTVRPLAVSEAVPPPAYICPPFVVILAVKAILPPPAPSRSAQAMTEPPCVVSACRLDNISRGRQTDMSAGSGR
jgi:hypothetical protein